MSVPALGLLRAQPRPPGNYWKWEGYAKHYRGGSHVNDASASADRKLDALCKRPAYRAANAVYCPGSRLRPRAVASRPGRRIAHEPPTTGEWDFGPPNPVRPSPYLAPNYAINQILLPTGKILLISKPTDAPAAGETKPDNGSGTAHVFDPTTGQYKAVDPPNIPGQDSADTAVPNLFCVGHVQLADGRILIAGGQRASSTATHGIQGHRGVWIFNPWTETWQVQGLMRHGRWYPTLTLLADGRVAIMSGFDEFGRGASPGIEGERINREIEVFTPNANPNQPGTLELVSPGLPTNPSLEGPSHAMDLYPRNMLLPDGRILMAGQGTVPAVLTPRAPGAGNWSWQDLPAKSVFAGSGYEYGLWSTSVLRPFTVDVAGNTSASQVQLIGGAAGPSVHGKTHTFALNTANVSAGFPKVPPANSIQVPRAHHNTVQLPNGSMVVIGGGLGNIDPNDPDDVPEVPGGNHLYDKPTFSTEVYRPASNTWTLGPSNIQRRTYHSTALLLPDGRVISAGDDRESKRNHPKQWVVEYYKPAYFFKGARPSIGSAPAAAGYGAAIPVATADAESIASVVLTQPGSTTHGVDMQQRTITMTPTVADGGHISVTTPSNRNVAPPGYYMMSVVNNQGVPSVAHWIRIDPNAATNTPPTVVVSAEAAASTVGQRVSFSSASSDSDGTIATQDWDLNGDGVFGDASGPAASTIFTKAGAVTVSMRVTDNLGAAAVGSVVITVTGTSELAKSTPSPAPQNQAPIASFTVSSTRPYTGRPPTRLVDTSRDLDGAIVERAWDLHGDLRFNDGGLPSLNRAFKTAGRHVVRLRVTDNGGATSEAEVLLLARNRRPLVVVSCAFIVRRHGKATRRPGVVKKGTCVIKPAATKARR